MTVAFEDTDDLSDQAADLLWSIGKHAVMRVGRAVLLAVAAMALCYGQSHVDYPISVVGLATFVVGCLRPFYLIAVAILLWLLALFFITPAMLPALGTVASIFGR